MSERKRVLGSDLRKIDAHVITPEEYAEVPELKQGFFEQADEYKGDKLVRRGRGRPQAATRKVLLSVRYSPEVVEYFRATGEGWQMRMDQVLREHVTRATGTPATKPSRRYPIRELATRTTASSGKARRQRSGRGSRER